MQNNQPEFQSSFLEEARKSQKEVRLFLMNGFQMLGKITRHDAKCVWVRDNKNNKVESNKGNANTNTSTDADQTVVDGTTTEDENNLDEKTEQTTESKPLVTPEVSNDVVLEVNKN